MVRAERHRPTPCCDQQVVFFNYDLGAFCTSLDDDRLSKVFETRLVRTSCWSPPRGSSTRGAPRDTATLARRKECSACERRSTWTRSERATAVSASFRAATSDHFDEALESSTGEVGLAAEELPGPLRSSTSRAT